jgi:hypothetical protein
MFKSVLCLITAFFIISLVIHKNDDHVIDEIIRKIKNYRYDIRDTVKGSWIRSAKNIVFNDKLNILCADLRTNRKYFSGRKYIYKRNCIDVPDKSIILANDDGKFIKSFDVTHANKITKVIGIDQSKTEYFPGNTLCYTHYEEYCINYDNFEYVVFRDYPNNGRLELLTEKEYFRYTQLGY